MPETRQTMRHLVFVEQALAKKGLKALHKLPLDVLQHALAQLEGLVTNWSPVGLASLRSKMAVAIIDRDHLDHDAEADVYRTAAVLDAPCPRPVCAPESALGPSDDDALAAAYAALGAVAPGAVETQSELGSRPRGGESSRHLAKANWAARSSCANCTSTLSRRAAGIKSPVPPAELSCAMDTLRLCGLQAHAAAVPFHDLAHDGQAQAAAAAILGTAHEALEDMLAFGFGHAGPLSSTSISTWPDGHSHTHRDRAAAAGVADGVVDQVAQASRSSNAMPRTRAGVSAAPRFRFVCFVHAQVHTGGQRTRHPFGGELARQLAQVQQLAVLQRGRFGLGTGQREQLVDQVGAACGAQVHHAGAPPGCSARRWPRPAPARSGSSGRPAACAAGARHR
jgi:hypothetical protein